MFCPKLSKIARFCFIKINFFLGGGTPDPHFILTKRTMVTKISLYKNHAPLHPPPTHTRTEHPFASEKSRTRRKCKEKIVPLKIHRILPLAFFFLLSDVRPLLLKISGSAHGLFDRFSDACESHTLRRQTMENAKCVLTGAMTRLKHMHFDAIPRKTRKSS